MVIAALAFAGCAVEVPEAVPPEAFLFAYFTGNGEDGLHLAGSVDGYRWEALGGGKSFLPPLAGKEKLLRDPCVARGPDGLWHVVWTCGWWENRIGYAATADFVHWTKVRELPVMAHEPTVRNTWAPEVVLDAANAQFVLFWASTIPGRFPATDGSSEDGLDHRLYATTTRDWVTFTETRLLLDPGFSVIDGTFVRTRDGELLLLVKDETLRPEKKHLRCVPAEGWLGPFGPPRAPFSRSWVEGPSALWVGDHFVVYFDCYRDGRFGALRTTDFATFEDVSDRIVLPAGCRHGTASAVPLSLLEALRSRRGTESPRVNRRS